MTDAFSPPAPSQRPDELSRFIDLLRERNVRSYLEIGARHGGTFHAVMTSLPAGSVGVAVDLPDGPWGKRNSRDALNACVTDLCEMGYRAHALIGDSKSLEFLAMEALLGREICARCFDAILIDGDHSYVGVKSDWQKFGHLGKLVAFHDIDCPGHLERRFNMKNEVQKFWEILNATGAWKTEEIIGERRGMGLGIVYPWEKK